ncbi:DUF4231 domain-containing protein [Streptomyces synnematoformans]|uniref:DUF4231 domain-containing protein n=1 Tax=Streptomyces synnematoformans TaxID=415721 RepID=A0ABN2X8J6_9ACTN
MAAARTPGPSTTLRDQDLPPLFRVNDLEAIVRQRESFQSIRLHLTILLLAATAAMAAEQTDTRAPTALAAVLYGLTIVVGLHTARRRARAAWQVHRAVAETVKSLAWHYMVRGGPLHTGVPNPEALFAERLEERLSELRQVGWEDSRATSDLLGAGQITPAMRAVRATSFEARRNFYLRERVLEQLVWYRNKSVQEHQAAVRWSSVTAGLTFIALLAAVLRTVGMTGGWDLTGLLSAAAAAAVAWHEVRRHRPLTYAHSRVEQELDTMRVAMGTTVTEENWADAVAETERLVSPQHTDWLGRFGS